MIARMKIWPWKRSRWRNVNFLDLVPRRRVAHEEDEEGRIVLLQPRYTDPVLGRWLQPRLRPDKRWIRVPLDSRGTWLWRHIDGARTVGELAAGFQAAFPEDQRDIPLRVSQYVGVLHQHGWVALD